MANKGQKRRAATAAKDSKDRARLQVLCTREQEAILTEAAKKAGFEGDRSAWIVAQAIKAADAGEAGATVTLVGETAERLIAAAARQGIGAEQLVKQYLA